MSSTVMNAAEGPGCLPEVKNNRKFRTVRPESGQLWEVPTVVN